MSFGPSLMSKTFSSPFLCQATKACVRKKALARGEEDPPPSSHARKTLSRLQLLQISQEEDSPKHFFSHWDMQTSFVQRFDSREEVHVDQLLPLQARK